MKYRSLIVCLVILLLLIPLALASLPSETTLNKASQSVVKVLAKNCGDHPSRAATGFVWQRANQVVTALHVVAGCDQISIRSEYRGAVRGARLLRVLKNADLALLEIDEPLDLPSLQKSAKKPALHDDLVALGYELAAPSISSKNLQVSFGSSRLADLLPDRVSEEIRRAGTPSLSLEILRLQGHLVPGLSGAPIVNDQGELVAIGDGGLENGAASISWALPVAQIEALTRSQESMTPTIIAASSHFAASLETSRGQSVVCGDMTFTKLRTRLYGELAASSDDPVGLAQIQQMAQIVGLDIDQLQFDIYEHLDTGATVALPAGLALTSHGRECTASQYQGALTLYLGSSMARSVAAVDTLSIQFENSIAAQTGLGWEPDPIWSYPMAQQRFDGFR
ncbi:MAG: hypothetical protein FD130_661, partial [Halothiobacillaceae bacterium]